MIAACLGIDRQIDHFDHKPSTAITNKLRKKGFARQTAAPSDLLLLSDCSYFTISIFKAIDSLCLWVSQLLHSLHLANLKIV